MKHSGENDTLKIKVSNGSKITLTESETAMLQTEFIVTNENDEEPTWYANYVKEGSNGSTSLTNSSTGFQYNSDTTGPYFLVNSSSVNVTLDTYPNQSYLFNMDSTSGAVLCYEIWCYYSGDDGTISNKGWLMGAETTWGPYIILTDSRIGGIGTSPGANDNNTYSSLTSPGYITDNANKGQLLHIVGYWKQIQVVIMNAVYILTAHIMNKKLQVKVDNLVIQDLIILIMIFKLEVVVILIIIQKVFAYILFVYGMVI